MRTFHTGGVAGADITQGLPRVEELFEARKPKGLAIISEVSGTVRIEETKKKRIIHVTEESGEDKAYDIPFGSRIKVTNGDKIDAGDELTEGSVNPHDILAIKGAKEVKNYLLSEVQKVYRLQGVDINDKHLEVVVRQMTRKVKIKESGDTELLPGTLVDIFDFDGINAEVAEQGGEPATGDIALLGITKAALATESFLSAASFQETKEFLLTRLLKERLTR
jgi:DNA-directed RNA polymerase subunit beta'